MYKMIPGFSTRLGWEREWKSWRLGWESCMTNSKDWRSERYEGNLTFPTHTV